MRVIRVVNAVVIGGAGILIVSTLLIGLTPIGDLVPEPADDLNETEIEAGIHDEINDRREARGLATLDRSPRLDSAAGDYSERMVEEDFYSHTTPDGASFSDRALCDTGGENLNTVIYHEEYKTGERTVYYESQDELINGAVTEWMFSDSHRENLLDPRYSAQGIGVDIKVNGSVKVLVTQQLC